MWATDMSNLEYREEERRVKIMLFWSMVGLLVGLVGATLLETDQREEEPRHEGATPQNQVNERTNALSEQITVKEKTDA
ncbi:MAG: hypothetical protein LZF60_380003 [Nitrospira sp.]|nr:MAG: hypothetical protein LZF60_380003 [Nitrospira sp.]